MTDWPLRWLNPLLPEYRLLRTSLSPEECRSRLQPRAAAHYRELFYLCGRPLVGWAEADGFNLARCVPYRNAYKPWAKGKIAPSEQGTLIGCRIGAGYATLAGAALLLVIWVAVTSILSSVAIIYVLFACWLGSVLVRLYLARNDRHFLLGSLGTNLEAREVAPSVMARGGGEAVNARQLFRELPGHRVPYVWRLIWAVLVITAIGKLALVVVSLWKYG